MIARKWYPAYRFDGRHAEAVPVLLRLEPGYLVVETADGAMLERERLDRASISAPLDHAPRLITLASGATLEVRDGDQGFAHGLRQAGVSPSFAVRLQRRWPTVLVALALLVALLALVYVKVLPAAARWAAFALPARLEARMGEQILTVLDRHYLKPSGLDPLRRRRIAERFSRAAAMVAPGVTYRLEFRAAGEDTVNAMALPGGTIILLDGLVTFAADDDGVLGVLGHELGHVVHKHSARELIQSVGVGILASLLWGDFSGVAASVPTVIGMLRYSRDSEREADEFAMAFLRAQGLSARPLYDFFAKVLELQSSWGAESIPDFFSTHPSTEERLQRLRQELRRDDWTEPHTPPIVTARTDRAGPQRRKSRGLTLSER